MIAKGDGARASMADLSADISKAESIFLSAAEIVQPVERRAFLDSACAGDPALRRKVDDLLRRFELVGSLLESAATDLSVTADRHWH
jgi:hypothetical protein